MGVGPSMASGNQMYSGIWADFPTAPRKSSSVIAVAVVPFMAPGAAANRPVAWPWESVPSTDE